MKPVIPLRSSPAFWAAPIIVAATFFAYWNHLGHTVGQYTWVSYAARASDGLNFGLPLAAGAAAWAGHRYAGSRFPRAFGVRRSLLRQFLSQTWPLFAAVTVGFAAIVLVQVERASPAPQLFGLEVLITFAAMTVAAIGFGYSLGVLMPVPVALPISIFAVYEWITFPQLDNINLSWRNITGYTLYACCDVTSYGPDTRSVIAPILTGVAIVVVVVLVMRFRLLAILPSAAVIVAAVFAANVLVAGTQAQGQSVRPASDLHCSGSAPKVCVYPEQAHFGMDAVASKAWNRARDAGVTLPNLIEASDEAKETDDRILFSAPAGADDEEVLKAMAVGTYNTLTCNFPSSEPSALPSDVRTVYALGVVFGADPEGTLPQMFASEDAAAEGSQISPDKVREEIGISTTSEATKAVKAWLDAQHDCRP